MKDITLEFRQQDNKRGNCACFLNNVFVDACDMNYTQKYTQAHVVLASAWRTFKTTNINVIITGEASVGQYPINQLKQMAENLIDTDFNDVYGYTHIYSKALD
jgi:hypothetical protein